MKVRTGVMTGVLAAWMITGAATTAKAQFGGGQNQDPTANPAVMPSQGSGGTSKLPRQQVDWNKISDPVGANNNNPVQQEQQNISAMNDRQKQLVAETARLVVLANELKAAMEKTNKDTLSLEVMKKADEIEKLAHQMKEKLKN